MVFTLLIETHPASQLAVGTQHESRIKELYFSLHDGA